MTIETNITNRRELASALAQYLNTRAVYLGPPTFAYQIGDIHLSREEILSGDDLDGIFPLEDTGIAGALALVDLTCDSVGLPSDRLSFD